MPVRNCQTYFLADGHKARPYCFRFYLKSMILQSSFGQLIGFMWI